MEEYSFNLNIDKTIKGIYFPETDRVAISSAHKNQRNAGNLSENLSAIVNIQKNGSKVIIKLKNDPYIEINTKTGEVKSLNELTSFETRMFARAIVPELLPYLRFDEKEKPKQLTTDLHTHFAAALTPEQLINIARGKGVEYSKQLLEKAGIDTSSIEPNENGKYLLDKVIVSAQNYDALVAAMKIDTSEQETFNRMENIYSFRGPITKNPNMFESMIWETARDAKANGINYMELSLSSIISNTRELAQLEEILPKVEKETGVKLRFLGALSRHSDKEWNMDETERLKISGRSPYIVGCDVMGHETNSTQEFYNEIKELAKNAIKNDPSFVIRVHAGENPLFKNNVRWVLIAVEDAHRECEKETGRKDLPYPQVRIGHGIYGFDEQPSWEETDEFQKISTMELCKKIDPIIEFNMSSNLSLNNINDINEIPIKKYVNSGIRVVLGTDGRGIYSTTIAQEMILAKQAGLTRADFEKIRQTEKQVIEAEQKRFKSFINNEESKSSEIDKDLKNIKTNYFTPEVAEKYRKKIEEVHSSLGYKISPSGAETDPEKVKEAIEGKKPIMITGSSKKHWPIVEAHPDQVSRIREILDVLVLAIDPDKAYLVTGGTNYGVEKELHKIAHEYNENNKNKVVVLGTLTEEIASDPERNAVEPNTITHAMIPELDGKPAARWFDLPDTVLNILQEQDGKLIAIAGGSIVSDIIQRSHNIGLDMALMCEVEGASGDKAKALEGNNYSFYDVTDFLQKFISENKDILKPGVTEENIEKLYNIAVKREAERQNVENQERQIEPEQKREKESSMVVVKNSQNIQKLNLDEINKNIDKNEKNAKQSNERS